MCWLSWNLGAATFWNPQGLSRPVIGFLYLHLYQSTRRNCLKNLTLQSDFHSYVSDCLFGYLLIAIQVTAWYISCKDVGEIVLENRFKSL
jgi:hypothetical protein